MDLPAKLLTILAQTEKAQPAIEPTTRLVEKNYFCGRGE
jgi:hypothetical protein